MTILSLLIALALERISVKPHGWQCQTYSHSYYDWLVKKDWLRADTNMAFWFFAALLPALVIAQVLQLFSWVLFSLVLQTAILYLCLGSQVLRDTYRCFMQAANRGDYEACHLYSVQMGHCDTKPDKTHSFGLRLVWLNYQHYIGVTLWFIAFGAPGAVFYVLVRDGFEYACAKSGFSVKGPQSIRHLADWVPVRLAALGMLLVGNFSRALSVWLQSLFAFAERPLATLTRVASASEVLPKNGQEEEPSKEPTMFMKLAKRNMMFVLVVTSILTLTGAL